MSATVDAPALRFPEFLEEWVHSSLGEFCDCLSGYPIPGNKILEVAEGVLLLRGANITEGSIRHSTELDRYYNGDLKDLGRFILNDGDVVIGMDGSKVGKNVAIVSGKDVGSFLIQRVARLRALKNHSLHFVYHQIIGARFRAYVDVVNTSSGIPHISLKQIRDFPIRKPPFPEQQKVADFLGAVDTRVGLLRRRRDALRDYKKGMMQRLFSQELRFTKPDGSPFPDWQEKRLGEVAIIYQSETMSQSQLDPDGQYPVFGANGQIGWLDRYNHETEQVAITCRGNTCGAVTLVPAKSWITGNSMVVNLDQSQSLIKGYAYNLFQYTDWKYLITGSGQPQITGEIKKHKFLCPHPEEQQKIADTLTALDTKIDAVTAQMDAMLRFKKGLLQQMFV
jgi:type I restriction enzyme S subunit